MWHPRFRFGPARKVRKRTTASYRARFCLPKIEGLECRLQPTYLFLSHAGNVQVSQDAGHPEQDRSESSLAVNPTNALNMVGASKRFTNPSTYEFTCAAYASFDAGKSWTEAAPLKLLSAGDPGSGGETWTGVTDPVVTFDNLGYTYLVTMAFNGNDFIGIAVYQSVDGGKTWSSPNLIHQSTWEGTSGDDKPWATADNNPASPYYGSVYITWDNDVDGGLDFARTTDHGKSWKGEGGLGIGWPLVLDGFYSSLSVADNGTLYVAYRDFGFTNGRRIRLVKSTDGGDTFSSSIDVASNIVPLDDPAAGLPQYGDPPFRFPVLPGGKFRVETFPTIAAGKGDNVVVAWADYRDNVSRIYYRNSTNGAAGWQGPASGQQLLTGSIASDANQHDFHPQLARSPNGDIGVAFYEFGPKSGHGATPLIDVDFTASVDGGANFPNRFAVTSQPWDPSVDAPLSHGNNGVTFIGDYFGLAASNKGFFPFWTDTRTGIQEIFTDAVTVTFIPFIAPIYAAVWPPPPPDPTKLIALFGVDPPSQEAVWKLQTMPNGPFANNWSNDLNRLVTGFAMGQNANGLLELFAIDAANHTVIDKQQRTLGGPFSTDWSADLGGLVSAISVGRNADGRLELFGIDARTHAVVHKAQLRPNGPFSTDWSNDLGGSVSAISVASDADGRLELLAVDARTNMVEHKAQLAPNSRFNTNWSTELGGPVAAISVGRNADGRLELFAIDALTYAVEHKAQLAPNGSFNRVWSEDLDGATRVLASGLTVGTESDGRLEVFAVDAGTRQVMRQTQVRPNGTFSRQWINDLGDFSGPATRLDAVAGIQPHPAGVPFPITITARDAQNAVATGYRGTVHFTSTDPQAVLPADYTFTPADNGVHTFTILLGTVGSQTVTVADTHSSSLRASAVVRVVPGALDHFVVTTLADTRGATAGNPFDVTVIAQDAYHNTVTGYTGTVTFSSLDPYGATLPADYTFQATDQGRVTFPAGATLYTAGTWDVTVTDTTTGAAGSDLINVTAAPAVTFQLLAPASTASGQAFDLTVIAVDPYGNTDMTYQGTITFASTDPDPGVVLPPAYTFRTSDAGMVTFPGGVTLITLGDQTLTATDTVSGITGSTTVTVNPAGPSAAGGGGHLPTRTAEAQPRGSAMNADDWDRFFATARRAEATELLGMSRTQHRPWDMGSPAESLDLFLLETW